MPSAPPWIIPAYAGSTHTAVGRSRRVGDHPRIRGEHPRSCSTVAVSLGSSPHTRGAPSAPTACRSMFRIIPAYAGSTAAGASRASEPADHPRIRGEHVVPPTESTTLGGSSPHTRGARQIHLNSTGDIRDHPRIRGEHGHLEVAVYPVQGSSPHTRGALYTIKTNGGESRIIPAYAGSTGGTAVRAAAPADHPRIRGEHA